MSMAVSRRPSRAEEEEGATKGKSIPQGRIVVLTHCFQRNMFVAFK